MAKDVEAFGSGEGSSIFNSTLQCILRLDNLWKQSNYYSSMPGMSGLNGWCACLNSIDRELSAMYSKEDESQVDVVRVRTVDGRRGILGLEDTQRIKLDRFERVLRRIQQSKGLGVKADPEADGDFYE